MISKKNLKDKLIELEQLIDKTQVAGFKTDEEHLFSQHLIDVHENIKWVDGLKNSGYGLTTDERERLVYIMRTSNRVWKMRNKMLSGDWDSKDIVFETMESELRDHIGAGSKITAIKHYRHVMNEELGKRISLRDAKERIDNLAKEMRYEQGMITQN